MCFVLLQDLETIHLFLLDQYLIPLPHILQLMNEYSVLYLVAALLKIYVRLVRTIHDQWCFATSYEFSRIRTKCNHIYVVITTSYEFEGIRTKCFYTYIWLLQLRTKS